MTELRELSAKATQGVWEFDGNCGGYITEAGDKIARAYSHTDVAYITALVNAHRAGRLVEKVWQPIESPPRDGTKAILYFPQDATDFDGVDYSWRFAIYRCNEKFPHGTWCDQGTNHDSFEGPDLSGDDFATHYIPLPTPPDGSKTDD